MTEDERTELVRRLRELHHFIATTEEGAGTRTTCGNAADEVERLAAERDRLVARVEHLEQFDKIRCGHADGLLERVKLVEAERDRLVIACEKLDHEVCQTFGKALGYPWLKDDPANFPAATEADGVCVRDQTAESLAEMAADHLAELRERVRELEAGLRPLGDWLPVVSVDDPDDAMIANSHNGPFRVLTARAVRRAAALLAEKGEEE